MNKVRSLSWQAALLLPLAAGFFGALLSITISSNVHTMASGSSSTEATAASTRIVSASTVTVQTKDAAAASNPARLIIPALGINATVQSVGLARTGTGAIGTPDNATDVAWYNRGPVPGSPGIAIIDGHLDTKTVPEAIFYNLGNLAVGESIYVKDRAGVEQRFVVTARQQLAYDADTSMLFKNSGTPQLVLITCAGDWIPAMHEYTNRIVVFAALANTE